MPDEKLISSVGFLPTSLMYFCSGEPMHFCSGVDNSPALDAFIKVARVHDWTSALDKFRRTSAPASNKDNVRKADAQGAFALI